MVINVWRSLNSFSILLILVALVQKSAGASRKASAPASRPAISLSVGSASQHSCLVLNNGLGIKCFGPNSNGQLGQLTTQSIGENGIFDMGDCLRTSALGPIARPKAVVTGSTFTCALLDQGTVRCFGSCSTGACGNGQTSGSLGDSLQTNPGIQPPLIFPSPVEMLTSGEGHVCVILKDQTARCWGTGSSGQLGTGTTVDILPRPPLDPIDFGPGRRVLEISAGYTHTCAITTSPLNSNETDLFCFGSCVFGKCGSGGTSPIVDMGHSLTPVDLGMGPRGKRRWAIHVSAGAAHTCVVLNTRDAACFGLGRLHGTGATNNVGDEVFEMEDLVAVNLGGRPVLSVSAGQQHSCAVVLDGNDIPRGVCWGEGVNGILGYDTEEQVLAPAFRTVLLPKGLALSTIQAYSTHTCALSTQQKGGQVFCWGSNKLGRLGTFSLGSTGPQCTGCRKGQMSMLKRLFVGCTVLSENDSCPFLGDTNAKCKLCQKSWNEDLCRLYSLRCKWNRKLKRCGIKP